MSSSIPGRKRPQCHTCGGPMSGHKRVNSKPICPGVTPTRSRSTRAKRELSPSHSPTILHDEFGKQENAIVEQGTFIASQPSTSTPAPITSSFRSFARSFRLETPLASLFTTPKSQADAIQRRAAEQGLFSGTVYKPRRIKGEESQRWLVLGRDASAVDTLLECQERQLHIPGGSVDVEKSSQGPGIFQVLLAGAMGGFAVYYLLISL